MVGSYNAALAMIFTRPIVIIPDIREIGIGTKNIHDKRSFQFLIIWTAIP